MVNVKKIIIVAVIALAFSLLLINFAYSGAPPHGGFVSTSDYCEQCHDLHNAAAGYQLLKYGSQSEKTEVCDACHNPGGPGALPAFARPYYEVATASVKATHRPTMTLAADSGSSTLGIGTSSFFSSDQPLCFACHSPHDNDTVIPYTDDNSDTATSHLLRKGGEGTRFLPGSGSVAVDSYGGDWCADCHNLNAGMGGTNHQVNTLGLTYASASLARSSGAFVMSPVNEANTLSPDGRTWPICQFCHEDSRQVWDHLGDAISPFAFTTNPVFNAFPHEGDINGFRIESKDDLCLNCHDTPDLP